MHTPISSLLCRIHPDMKAYIQPPWQLSQHCDLQQSTPEVDDCSFALNFLRLLLLLGGDSERNPGPESKIIR